MSRDEKRASRRVASPASNKGASQIFAVHEAGHAIAMMLAASELGYGIREAVGHIEMGKHLVRPSLDGKTVLRSPAHTSGPVFSREIAAASQHFKEADLSEAETIQGGVAREIVESGRAAGADIGKWYRARVFNLVSGSVAHAIVSKRSFGEIWNGDHAEGDVLEFVNLAIVADIPSNQAVSIVDRMAVVSAYLMDEPEIWAVVLALANELPLVGKIDSAKIVSIITRTISETNLTGKFAAALEEVREIELEIGANEVAVATLLDGSDRIIKGREVVKKLEMEGKHTIEVLKFNCTFPVYPETLWLAFGDGAASREGAKAA